MDYNQKKEDTPMLYVSPDGNYGNADGLVQVDDESFDDHFYGYLDEQSDWLRPSYVEWFADNPHDLDANAENGCDECDDWIGWAKS